MGFLQNQGIDAFYNTRIRCLNVAAILRAARLDEDDSVESEGKIADTRGQDSREGRQDSGKRRQDSTPGGQDSGEGRQDSYCTLPASSPTLPPPPPPSSPKKANPGRVVEGFIQNLATKEGMGVPGKKAREVLDKLVAEHGEQTTVDVLKQFLKRPKGISGLTQPWAVFITEADTWTEIVVRKAQEERARRVNQRAGGDEIKKRVLEELAKLDPPLTPDEQAKVDKAVAVGEEALAGKKSWVDNGGPEHEYFFWWQQQATPFFGLCDAIKDERYKAQQAKYAKDQAEEFQKFLDTP